MQMIPLLWLIVSLGSLALLVANMRLQVFPQVVWAVLCSVALVSPLVQMAIVEVSEGLGTGDATKLGFGLFYASAILWVVLLGALACRVIRKRNRPESQQAAQAER
jgi:hypothetical protein